MLYLFIFYPAVLLEVYKRIPNTHLITHYYNRSTDNTLRRWNNSNGESQLIYSGHTNEKNFVGLSVSNDWISCGSEDNTVYAYHKDCKTPITKYRFPHAPVPFHDPQYTQEDDQLSSGFVSSTCWKSNTSTLLAANSKGIIKVLQMVP